MDHKIYSGPQRELGVYGTRRYPKGSSAGLSVASGGGSDIPVSANPAAVDMRYSANAVAPHGVNIRATYTVPPYRRAKLQTVNLYILRGAAAGAAGEHNGQVRIFRRNALVSNEILMISSFQNVAFAISGAINNPGQIELFEGDMVEILTFDNSTGGSINYFISAVGVEYDAVSRGGQAYFAGNDSQGFSGSGSSSSGVPKPGYWGTGGFNSGLPIV